MDDAEYKALTESLNDKLEQFYQDPYYQAPAERTPTMLTVRDRQQMVDTYERHHIYDYEPNRLAEVQIRQLAQDIDNTIHASGDLQQVTHLAELKEYIQRNGGVFPELSHGTSSAALGNILHRNLRPRSMLSDSPLYQHGIGEGDRFRSSQQRSRSLSMGIGQGGLGTAMAYARMVEKPWWNYNRLTKEQIVKQLNIEYAKLAGREESQAPEIASRLNKLRLAIIQKDAGIPLDFPIVLGYARVDNQGGPYPHNSNYMFLTSKTYKSHDKEAQSVKYSEGLDSEVLIKEDAVVDTEELKTIACPADKILQVRAILDSEQIENVEIISLEALDELQNFGIPRVREAEKRAYNVLSMNSHQDIIAIGSRV